MFTILEAGANVDGRPLPAFVVARDGLYLRKRSLLGVSQTKVERVGNDGLIWPHRDAQIWPHPRPVRMT